MRFTVPSDFCHESSNDTTLSFTASRGERLQITALEPGIVRVRFLPDGHLRLDRTWMIAGSDGDVPREGRSRDDLSPFTLPDAEVSATGATARLKTSELDVRFALTTGAISWLDGATGRLFAADADSRPYAYDRAGRSVFHFLEHRFGERYYGFGETAGPLDKAGARLRMEPRDALGYDAERADPLYKHIPFYITFAPESGAAYGVLYDNLSATTFDLGRERDSYAGSYRSYQADDGDIDYYFLYGPTIAGVTEKLARLTGAPALPPRWSLGYLASGMGYTEDRHARERLEKFITDLAEYDIPCDAFQLSSGYGTDDSGKRCVFAWNSEKMGAAAALAETFRAAGLRLTANIKPCLILSHPEYEAVAEQGGFVRAADEELPEVSSFWSETGSYIDFTAPAGYDWWAAQVRDVLLANGILSTWNDNNEYEIWDDQARCDGFGQETPIGLIRSTQTLLMLRSSRDAQVESAPTLRPFLVTRSGSPGGQRYAQTWSGDNVASWHAFKWNLPMGLGLSLSGWPNTGHDIGGFVGAKPDAELLIRWVQCGVFFPRFTIHSWQFDNSATEAWTYPEALPIIRAALNLRYRLLPYLYSLFVESARAGHPIMRPLVYEFPRDPRCEVESFDFMLGSNLFIAPILDPDVRSRAVYLPAGRAWFDFWTGARHVGGESVEVDAPLDHIPVFAPEGAIVPMGKPMRSVGAAPDDLREVYVFPHSASGSASFTLHEDDGETTSYRRGQYADVTLTIVSSAKQLRVSARVDGTFALSYRQLTWVFPQGERRAIVGAKEIEPDEQGRRRATSAL